MRAVAVDFDRVLGDTRPLWEAWLAEAARRLRVELPSLPADRGEAAPLLDRELGAWAPLLERFAEEHGPLYLRPRGEVNAALRRLKAGGATVGAFTDAPEPLARVAAAQLGVARRLDALEAGRGALPRLLRRLGEEALVVRTVEELLRAA